MKSHKKKIRFFIIFSKIFLIVIFNGCSMAFADLSVSEIVAGKQPVFTIENVSAAKICIYQEQISAPPPSSEKLLLIEKAKKEGINIVHPTHLMKYSFIAFEKNPKCILTYILQQESFKPIIFDVVRRNKKISILYALFNSVRYLDADEGRTLVLRDLEHGEELESLTSSNGYSANGGKISCKGSEIIVNLFHRLNNPTLEKALRKWNKFIELGDTFYSLAAEGGNRKWEPCEDTKNLFIQNPKAYSLLRSRIEYDASKK